MNSWLFLSLFTAHLVGDFYCQNDKLCRQKEAFKIKSRFLYAHSLIIRDTSKFWHCHCSRINHGKSQNAVITDFEEYIRQGEPSRAERAQAWRTAIGLQDVDVGVPY